MDWDDDATHNSCAEEWEGQGFEEEEDESNIEVGQGMGEVGADEGDVVDA